MICVVDASVALKWFVAEEHLKKEAIEVLDELKSSPSNFAVPELFFNEMLSAFCKILDDARRIREYMDILQDLGLARLGNGRELLSLAASMAKEYGITGCDVIYTANAKLVGGVWLTADWRAHKKIARLHISRFLGAL